MTQARDLGDAANKANFLDNVSSDIQTQVTANATAATNAILPAGLILPFGNTTAPTGYLACDGSAVSRTTYAALFVAIGTTWGAGNGSSTFNVPDLRGAFLRGTGSHGTSNMANGNDYAGPSVGSFENDQMQDHKHQVGWYNGTANAEFYNNYLAKATSNGYGIGSATLSFYNSNILTGANTASGHGTPRRGDETRPFNAGILYCIKT
jgi:microcystin-dependent protein